MLLPISLCTTTANFFITAQLSLYVLFVTRSIGLSPAALGAIFAVGGVGAFLGSAVASRLGARIGIGTTLLGAALTVGAGILIASGAGLPGLPALLVALVGRFLFHGALPVFNITEVSLRQLLMPAALRGRILATGRFMESGVMPLGALAGGLLGSALGPRAALAIAGLGVVASSSWILLTPLRTVTTVADAVAAAGAD
jgi:predicted MFS family arabinose efflux permease